MAKKKSDLTKSKEKLWELCKQITRQTYGDTCYTCGSTGLSGSNWQTGHFLTSSTCSMELRYDLKNLRPQCMPCNKWKSGNWPAYERHLIKDHGEAYVAELKERNERTKGGNYGIFWIREKTEEYKKLLNHGV